MLMLVEQAYALAAPECAESPRAAAGLLYEQHASFVHTGAPNSLLSPRLATVVEANLTRIRERGEVGAIDWNYWTDAQDGEQSKTARMQVVKVSAARATVRLRYQFYLTTYANPEPKSALVSLTKSNLGCWQVDDVARGKTSVLLLLQPQTSAPGSRE
jgi:hypothetical protein